MANRFASMLGGPGYPLMRWWSSVAIWHRFRAPKPIAQADDEIVDTVFLASGRGLTPQTAARAPAASPGPADLGMTQEWRGLPSTELGLPPADR